MVAAHSLHIWSLTVNKAALSVHLAIGWYSELELFCFHWHLLSKGATLQVAHQGGTYLQFLCNIKQLGAFLLPLDGAASSLQGYPQHSICQYPIIHLVQEWYSTGLGLNLDCSIKVGTNQEIPTPLTKLTLWLPLNIKYR